MSLAQVGLIITAATGSLAAGISKQLETPVEAALFAAAGIPVEALSLFGAVQFVLGLMLLFARPRLPAALALAAIFGFSAYILWPLGLTGSFAFHAAMGPLVLLAAFWSPTAFRRDSSYKDVISLGFSDAKR